MKNVGVGGTVGGNTRTAPPEFLFEYKTVHAKMNISKSHQRDLTSSCIKVLVKVSEKAMLGDFYRSILISSRSWNTLIKNTAQ